MEALAEAPWQKLKKLLDAKQPAFGSVHGEPLMPEPSVEGVREILEQTVRRMVGLTEVKVSVAAATGWKIKHKPHRVKAYFLAGELEHYAGEFRSARKAREFVKRAYKSMLLADLSFRPPMPINYVSIDVIGAPATIDWKDIPC